MDTKRPVATVDAPGDFRWGDRMSAELRERLEAEIAEENDREPEVNRRDLSGLQEMSDADLFLLWLRS